jgi:predicted RNA polymerase sigma factor
MAADAVDEAQLRDLIPGVLAALVHRGADFENAEDAVQEALIRAIETWPIRPPDDPKGWLITTAWRRFLDLTRSDIARHRREQEVSDEPPAGPTESADDTLQLYFLCAPEPHLRVGRGPDAAGRRRPHHPPDRAGLPGAGSDHGPTD